MLADTSRTPFFDGLLHVCYYTTGVFSGSKYDSGILRRTFEISKNEHLGADILDERIHSIQLPPASIAASIRGANRS